MKITHVLQILLLGTLWGSTYPLIKLAIEGVDPVTFVAGRVTLGALVLLAIMAALRLPLPRGRAWLHVALMAIVGNIFTNVLIAWGEQHTASNLAAILNGTTPFFTLLFAAWLLRSERFSRAKLAGLLLGFAGVATLTEGGLVDLTSKLAQGQLALVGASLFYGLSFAYARRFVRGEPLGLAAAQMIVATALMWPAAFAFGDVGATDLNLTRALAWFGVGALASGLSYVFYYRLIAQVGATISSYATYIVPVAGTIASWLVLGERVGPRTLLGILLIFAGLAVATRPGTSNGQPAAAMPDVEPPSAAAPAMPRE